MILKPRQYQNSTARILRRALVDLRDEGIASDGQSWANSGTGGSAYSLSALGTTTDLTRSTFNGKNVLLNAAAGYLEPSVPQTISVPFSMFAVGKANTATPGTNYRFISGAVTEAAAPTILINSGGDFSFNGGNPIALTGLADTDAHVFSVSHVGDSTSVFSVSGVGEVTGDSGSEEFGYMSLFASPSATQPWLGWCARVIIIPESLTAVEIARVQAYLSNNYIP